MNHIPFFSTIILTLLLGLRHGIDWDHIAAITDITGSNTDKKRGFVLGLSYSLGHALIIILFGILAIIIGVKLPRWVNTVMEPIVGTTLIILGVWLGYSILRHGVHFRKKSRWMVLFTLFNKFSNTVHHTFAHNHKVPHIHFPETYGKRTSFLVGMIHGIGAETPTQILLFLTAVGAGENIEGIMLLFTFVIGLITSNTIVTVISVKGFMKAQENNYINLGLGILTALFSLIVGLSFLFHTSAALPDFFGG